MAGKGFGLLFEMGCGKTLTAIAVAGAGYRAGKISRVLIVCSPKSGACQDYRRLADYLEGGARNVG